MLCTCKSSCADEREQVMVLLQGADLRVLGEQALDVPVTITRCLSQLAKARRAKALGFGDEVAALYQRVAEHDRAQAIRQINGVIAQIDARTTQPDWADLVKGAQNEFEVRDGAALLVEARERLQLELLEADGLRPADAREAITVYDDCLARISSAGLAGAVSLLREGLARGGEALMHPDMGGQPASPIPAATIICWTTVVALAGAALVLCAFLPLCWCCYLSVMVAWTALMWAACALVAPLL